MGRCSPTSWRMRPRPPAPTGCWRSPGPGSQDDDRTADALLALDQARDWPSFVEAAARYQRAAAEHRLRRPATATSASSARAGADPPRRATAAGRCRAGAAITTGTARSPSTPCRGRSTRRAACCSTPTTAWSPPSYPYLLTADWEPPYRARRLAELLAGGAARRRRLRLDPGRPELAAGRGLLPILLAAEPATPSRGDAISRAARLGPGDAPGRPEPLAVRGLVPRALPR